MQVWVCERKRSLFRAGAKKDFTAVKASELDPECYVGLEGRVRNRKGLKNASFMGMLQGHLHS